MQPSQNELLQFLATVPVKRNKRGLNPLWYNDWRPAGWPSWTSLLAGYGLARTRQAWYELTRHAQTFQPTKKNP